MFAAWVPGRAGFFSPVPGTDEWQGLVRKGLLTQDGDPLLHNKLVFPYIGGSITAQDFEFLRDFMVNPETVD